MFGDGFGKAPASNTTRATGSASWFFGDASASIIKQGDASYLLVSASIAAQLGLNYSIAVTNVYNYNNIRVTFLLKNEPFKHVTVTQTGYLGSTKIKLPRFTPLTRVEVIITGIQVTAGHHLITQKFNIKLYK